MYRLKAVLVAHGIFSAADGTQGEIYLRNFSMAPQPRAVLLFPQGWQQHSSRLTPVTSREHGSSITIFVK